MQIVPIFSNFLIVDTPDINLSNLKKYCYDKMSSSEGVKFSNVGGWQSEKLNFADPELAKLLKEISVRAYDFLNQIELVNKLSIENMWININKRNDFNLPHTHPGSFLSGVFYVQTPKDCGNIIFENPVDFDAWIVEKTKIKNNNQFNSSTWHIPPSDGLLVIFPSWLKHYVLPNKSDEDRISISFNIQIWE